MKYSVRDKRIRRHARVRALIEGTAIRPRLSVFRSNTHLMVQLIDDAAHHTIAQASDIAGKSAKGKKESRTTRAGKVGEKIAELAHAKGIQTAVFDRGGYRYHGLVKMLCEGARKGGLTI